MAMQCICGKHMLQLANAGTCLWCGHGDAHAIVELAYERNMRAAAEPAPLLAAALAATVVELRARWTAAECITAARDWELMHGALPRSRDWCRAKQPGETRPSYVTVQSIFGGWHAFMAAIADVPREQALAA